MWIKQEFFFFYIRREPEVVENPPADVVEDVIMEEMTPSIVFEYDHVKKTSAECNLKFKYTVFCSLSMDGVLMTFYCWQLFRTHSTRFTCTITVTVKRLLRIQISLRVWCRKCKNKIILLGKEVRNVLPSVSFLALYFHVCILFFRTLGRAEEAQWKSHFASTT